MLYERAVGIRRRVLLSIQNGSLRLERVPPLRRCYVTWWVTNLYSVTLPEHQWKMSWERDVSHFKPFVATACRALNHAPQGAERGCTPVGADWQQSHVARARRGTTRALASCSLVAVIVPQNSSCVKSCTKHNSPREIPYNMRIRGIGR